MTSQYVNLFLYVCKKKGQEFLEAAYEIFSYAVSHTRQAIESFFNWIQRRGLCDLET